MASPRLPFLYPNLMRAVKACEPSTYRSLRVPTNARPPRTSRAPFHTTRRHAQGSIQRRYGPAVEPNIPPPSKPKGEAAAELSGDVDSGASSENSTNTPEQSEAQAKATATPPQPEPEKSVQPAESRSQPEEDLDAEEEAEEEENEKDTPTPEIVHEAKQPPTPEEKAAEERKKAPIFDGNPLE
ncbi:hypothetical protein BDV06DRAFT_229434, partial [Aspergillus oleicola]